jgi:transcriptional regulator with XRE-family HTH domain
MGREARENRCLPTRAEHARNCRIRAGLTQEKVAEKSLLSTRTISDIENGVGASRESLESYAKAVGVEDWRELLTPAGRAVISDPTATTLSSPAGAVLVHLLSGRWNLELTFLRWRRRELGPEESVVVRGHMDLWIPTPGRGGFGVALGTLEAELRPPPESGQDPYRARILVVDEIDQVHCEPDRMTFRSKTFSRFRAQETGVKPKQQDGVDHVLLVGTDFRWSLSVTEEAPGRLEGDYQDEGGVRDSATVVATRA